MGAAYLAGITAGYWKDTEEVKENWKLAQTFDPAMKENRRQELLAGWEKAVGRSRDWSRA